MQINSVYDSYFPLVVGLTQTMLLRLQTLASLKIYTQRTTSDKEVTVRKESMQ